MSSETTTQAPFVIVHVKHEFTRKDIEDLLVTAFEGGSNYWIDEVQFFGQHGGSVYERALSCDGVMVKTADDHKVYALNSEIMRHGMIVLASKRPDVLNRIIAEQWDADDADAWLQCCLFEDVIYC